MLNCSREELLKVLSEDEIDFCSSVRIPYSDPDRLWPRLRSLQRIVKEAIAAGKVTPYPQERFERGTAAYVVSDDLGTHGVMNPADGKRYDSKSQYYAAVKAKGCHIVGNDKSSNKPKDIQGDFNVKNELRQALQQHLN